MGNNWFRKPGDLSPNERGNSISLHFTVAGNLEKTPKKNNSFNFEAVEKKLKHLKKLENG